MRSVQFRRLLLSLVGFVIATCFTCLVSDAAEPAAVKSSRGASHSAAHRESSTGQAVITTEAKSTEKVKASDASPESVFEASRQKIVQHFAHFNVSADHPNANKLLDADKPTITKYLSVPLKLTDKKISGDTAQLTYESTDPKFEFSMVCDFNKSDGKWTLSNESLKGEKGIALQGELYKDVLDAFPVQFGLIWASIALLIFAILVSTVAHLWLVVVACRASVPWGITTLLIPFVWIAFTVTHWQEAKKPVLTMLGALVVVVLTLAVPIGVMYSLRDVASAIPDTLMPKPNNKPLHEI